MNIIDANRNPIPILWDVENASLGMAQPNNLLNSIMNALSLLNIHDVVMLCVVIEQRRSLRWRRQLSPILKTVLDDLKLIVGSKDVKLIAVPATKFICGTSSLDEKLWANMLDNIIIEFSQSVELGYTSESS
ncbi:unnamed protein product [Arabis nemorensis]|uniref:NYN domain-containing protein n=1 Tax=Arabis nemorensis TaxID=586526 RepID=A0A565CAY9_9BRAS|nr:unnamed protein product [Arabis nemorensis]